MYFSIISKNVYSYGENKFIEISKNLARSENNFVELLKLCRTFERNEQC